MTHEVRPRRRARVAIALAFALALVGAHVQAQERPAPVTVPVLSPGREAAEAIERATAAVEGGRADAHRAELAARLAQAPGDRYAGLGLATLDRLTYAYPRADSALAALAAPATGAPRDDAIAAYARLGLAQTLAARQLLRETDAALARARAGLDPAAIPGAAVEALLVQAGARSRVEGVPAALATLDTVAILLARQAEAVPPRTVARLTAARQCAAASLLSRAARPGVAARVDSALAAAPAGSAVRAACVFARAQEFDRVGDGVRAAAALDTVAAMARAAGDRVTAAAALQWLGSVYIARSAHGPARESLAQALTDATAADATIVAGWVLFNVARSAHALGAQAEALDYARRAAALLERAGDAYGLAGVRSLEATLLVAAGDAAGARRLHEANLRWAERSGDAFGVARAVRGLAVSAAMERDWPTAQALLDSSMTLFVRAGGPAWRYTLHEDQATLALRRGDGARAAREVDSALAGFVPSQGAVRYRLFAARAEADVLRGDTAAAARALAEGAAALDAWRAGLPTDRLRALAFQTRSDFEWPSAERAIAAIAASGRVAEAFALAEGRRARALRDALLRTGARPEAPRTGGARRDAPTASSAASDGPSDPSPGAMTLDAVRGAIPDARTALLLFVAGRDGAPTTLLVVTRDGARAHLLPPERELQPTSERLTMRARAGESTDAPARTLGAALLGEPLRALPQVRRLVLVPDGALHHVPFELLDPDGRGPLGARLELSIAPSATTWALLRARPAAPRGARVLAFGDPSFTDPASGEPRPVGEQAPGRLAAAGREARMAASLAPASRALVGAAASEAALRRLVADDWAVVHFATHAVVDDVRPWASQLLLAPGGGEDGFLRASDLGDLPFGASLVVLSACRSAEGAVLVGEGVQGFASPLLGAGVRAVVASRWAVGDGEAARFMPAFYAGLREGLTVGEALARAARERRRAGAPAREWAAFTVVGDAGVRLLAPASAGVQ